MRRLWLAFLSVTTTPFMPGFLMLLAAIRSGVNGLRAEILEYHIRLHKMNPDQEMESPEELGEDLIELVQLI